MAKKRKKVEKLVVGEKDKLVDKVLDDKPACYGEKQDYCSKELCGEYFDTCEVKDVALS